jgi:flagellar biosynthesis/type III secretory pathway M-ring protein FliF/YscJ
MDRDDAARRGWIAGQAVVLAITAITMVILHPFAAWMVALLVLGQGVYFIWREYTARRAPDAETAEHARPSASTVNAAWFSLVVATLVWAAAFRGLLR